SACAPGGGPASGEKIIPPGPLREGPAGERRRVEKESLAEFLRPQPQESNQNPSFPATQGELSRRGKRGPPGGCASEMTLLMAEGVTFSQENEPLPPCNRPRKSGFAAFSTGSLSDGPLAVDQPHQIPVPPAGREHHLQGAPVKAPQALVQAGEVVLHK